jgi:hypothetical protein
MLYQDRVLGRPSLWSRLMGRLRSRGGSRIADLDILSLNAHLRRDLGLYDGEAGFRDRR